MQTDHVAASERRRLGVFVWSAGIVGTVSLVTSVVAFATGNVFGGSWLFLGGVGVLATLGRARRRQSVGALPSLMATVVVSVCCFLAWHAGGTAAPAMFALAVLPGVMALLEGRRGVLIWAIVCALVILCFGAVGPALPPSSLKGSALAAMQLMGPLGGVAFIATTSLAHEREVRRREASLQAARATAEQAQAEAEQARARAERANAAKSAFLATMSHEIRTPLTAVVGLAELMRATDGGDDLGRRLGMLQGAGRTLLGLVNDVLDLSRIEAGQLELDARPVDLDALVTEVGDMMAATAASRGVAVRAVHHGPAWVAGDPLRLRQVLLNLVGNAVKFTHEGEVCLETRAEPDAGGIALRMVVRDTGVGIAPARQAAVLQPYTQEGRGTAASFGGTGLGLSIVVGLVERMGGTLRLESEVGTGTTVTVALTLPAAEAPAAVAAGPATMGAQRILVAEDNPVNQEVVLMMLEHLGCSADVVGDGAAAIAAVLDEDAHYDIVLMDCQMPGTDGFRATRRLRAEGYTGPIIALTASATPTDRAACLAAGMDDFVSKPLTLDELGGALARQLGIPVPT